MKRRSPAGPPAVQPRPPSLVRYSRPKLKLLLETSFTRIQPCRASTNRTHAGPPYALALAALGAETLAELHVRPPSAVRNTPSATLPSAAAPRDATTHPCEPSRKNTPRTPGAGACAGVMSLQVAPPSSVQASRPGNSAQPRVAVTSCAARTGPKLVRSGLAAARGASKPLACTQPVSARPATTTRVRVSERPLRERGGRERRSRLPRDGRVW